MARTVVTGSSSVRARRRCPPRDTSVSFHRVRSRSSAARYASRASSSLSTMCSPSSARSRTERSNGKVASSGSSTCTTTTIRPRAATAAMRSREPSGRSRRSLRTTTTEPRRAERAMPPSASSRYARSARHCRARRRRSRTDRVRFARRAARGPFLRGRPGRTATGWCRGRRSPSSRPGQSIFLQPVAGGRVAPMTTIRPTPTATAPHPTTLVVAFPRCDEHGGGVRLATFANFRAFFAAPVSRQQAGGRSWTRVPGAAAVRCAVARSPESRGRRGRAVARALPR